MVHTPSESFPIVQQLSNLIIFLPNWKQSLDISFRQKHVHSTRNAYSSVSDVIFFPVFYYRSHLLYITRCVLFQLLAIILFLYSYAFILHCSASPLFVLRTLCLSLCFNFSWVLSYFMHSACNTSTCEKQ